MNLEELPMRTTVESNVNYSYQFTTVIITLFEKKTTKKRYNDWYLIINYKFTMAKYQRTNK